MKFYTGTAWPIWLERTNMPLCISAVTLVGRKTLPKAQGSWVLDSGAFSQITNYGGFLISAKRYARLAQRCADQIGKMDGAAIQDWMCEPFVLAKTGLSVSEHQKRTTESYAELRYHAPDIDWIPVLQGYWREDYLEHLALYEDYGDDLRLVPLVGVGSICRRQATRMVEELLIELNSLGLSLHGFGLKELALRVVAHSLTSADSMAWSFKARAEQFKLPGCSHRVCTNCLPWASQWRDRVLRGLFLAAPRERQQRLWT